MSLFENANVWKICFGVILLSLLIIGLVLLLRKKDNFCRCNSIGSRVLCENKEELNKKYVEGTLTENNF